MKTYRQITGLFLILACQLQAQLMFKSYNRLAGRREVPAYCLQQDQYGRLLIGTDHGILRYAGEQNKNAETLLSPNRRITAVYSKNDYITWAGSNDGILYKCNRTGYDSILLKSNDSRISGICELAGNLYIATYGNGLFLCDSSGTIQHMGEKEGLLDPVISSMVTDGKTIYCGTDGGIFYITPNDSNHFQNISNKVGLPDNIVRGLSLTENEIFVSMQDSGVCLLNLKSKKIHLLSQFNNWAYGPVLTAGYDADRHIVVATEKEGVFHLRENGMIHYRYNMQAGISAANYALIDREKQLWLTSRRGIVQVMVTRADMINMNRFVSDPNMLAVVPLSEKEFLAGNVNGIYRIKRDNDSVQFHKVLQETRITISCGNADPYGNTWFGTYGKGIYIIDKKGDCKRLNSEINDLTNNVSYIWFDDQFVYISTLGNGLLILKKEEGKYKITAHYTSNNGLASDYVYAAMTGPEGHLFAGTDGGGLQELKGNTFVSVSKRFRIRSNTVFSLCKDSRGSIWAISDADCILCFDGKKLSHFGTDQGIRESEPSQIIAAGDAVYVIHSLGIDRISIGSGEVAQIDCEMPFGEPNLNAVTYDNGYILCATSNGVLKFRTGNATSKNIYPTVFINGVTVNYRVFPFDSLSDFNYNQNNFTFKFGGIWLKGQDKIKYRYILDGYEKTWNETMAAEQVSYNNLQPGEYNFLVQSSTAEGGWQNNANYAFTISPPIWKRWWFWVLTLAISFSSFYVFIKVRLRALKRANLILEEKVEIRTREIAQQSRVIEEKNKELEQLSLVASKTDNKVVIMDPEGKLEYVNESYTRDTGLDIENLKKTYGTTIFEVSNNPLIKEVFKEAIEGKKSVKYESLNKKITNREAWDATTLTPVFDDNGQLKKLVIIDTDVTERKRQEQVIIQKNKDITDSISYARKIQTAILPPRSMVRSELPNSFILYMTKDIVSGDFYWFSKMYDFSIVAAIDCTGHGVPGAFMSLIGHNILNRIITELRIFDPSRILLELNNGVLGVLHKNENESKDGMDVAICKINHKSGIVEYAGAMRPLWILRDNQIIEIKADKIPIGTKQKDREESIGYITHQIQAEPNDTFYIFTDGYADQFGGPKDKKFSTGKFKELLIESGKHPLHEQEHILREAHIHWKRDNEQVDDILVIGFKP